MDDKTKALICIAINHVTSFGGRVDVEEYYVRLMDGRLELGVVK